MKKIQAFGQEIGATMPWGRRVGLLALCLIIGILLVACGGSTPQQPSTNAPAVSEDADSDQESQSATEEEAGASMEEDSKEEDEAETAAEGPPGTEEFGMTEEELVASIEEVEALIADCMNEAGFEYIPVDYLTVRRAMTADKSAPGLSDVEWAESFGFGITTLLDVAELPPQLADPNSVIRLGLGEQNIQIFNNLSETDQEAYNFKLFGENTDATFAYTLEDEDFSETGGCTRTALEQVFSPEELSASYYNPGDALIEEDSRVIAAIEDWAGCMREAGFDYDNPEDTESEIEDRLDAILDGADPEELSAEAQAALTELQGEERALAVAQLECEEEFIDPVVEQVETELYGGPQN